MNRAACLGLALLLAPGLFADVPNVTRLRQQTSPPAQVPQGDRIPVAPAAKTPTSQKATTAPAKKSGPLQDYSRLEIQRVLSAEFARVKKPLPGGKDGFHFAPGKPVDEEALRRAISKGGAAANPGDTVQLSMIEFKSNVIYIDINGGGKKRTRFRDRIKIEVGNTYPDIRTNQVGGPAGLQGVGSTLILDFGKMIPDMTPEDLKAYLAPFLDFSKQRSAAVNWVETLPPEIQKAIKDRRAVVGMDREMVIAALGRPEKKVRERNDDGVETEDWIYGEPPAKTIFVTFAGEKVIRVRQFPQ